MKRRRVPAFITVVPDVDERRKDSVPDHAVCSNASIAQIRLEIQGKSGGK
jgi:hypothetical protein